MSSLQKLPFFQEWDFLDRYRAAHAEEIQAAQADPSKHGEVNAAYIEALKVESKRFNKQRDEIAAANASLFLVDPEGVMRELEDQCTRSFSLSEMLFIYGIASVKSKRHGRGVLRHKGTDYAGTCSNWIATVQIGERTGTVDFMAYSDRHSRADGEANAALTFAREIVAEAKA